MAKNHLDRKEKENLQILFESFDLNRDGDISIKELVTVYKQRYNLTIHEGELGRIFRQIDINSDKDLTITEFILGGCNKTNLLCD